MTGRVFYIVATFNDGPVTLIFHKIILDSHYILVYCKIMGLKNLQENIDHIFFLHSSITKGQAHLKRLWEERRVTDDDILAVSQELDLLIAEYHRILMPVYKSRTRYAWRNNTLNML